jgi:hypothetical protein
MTSSSAPFASTPSLSSSSPPTLTPPYSTPELSELSGIEVATLQRTARRWGRNESSGKYLCWDEDDLRIMRLLAYLPDWSVELRDLIASAMRASPGDEVVVIAPAGPPITNEEDARGVVFTLPDAETAVTLFNTGLLGPVVTLVKP